MAIKRAAPGQNPFTVILNDVINDDRLGADGLGVLVYLISKPADWEVKVSDLRRQFGIGRDKAYKILGHLVELGYAKRYQGRDDAGGFSDNNYLIFDRIDPLPENKETAPLPDLPHPANPPLQRKEKKERTESRGAKGDQPYSEDFEDLWKQYPRTRNTSKKDAWNFYRMMTDEKQEQVRRAVPAFAAAMRAEGRTEDKIMHMIRFLRGGVYETVSAPAAARAAGATGSSAKPFWETATRQDWFNALLQWSRNWNWNRAWGPEPENPMRPNPPGAPKHHVPQDILDRFDLRYRGAMYSPEQKAEIQARVDAASKHTVDKDRAA